MLDGFIIIAFYLVPSSIWVNDSDAARLIRILIALAALLICEPICTGKFVTIGQYLMKVRVRRYDNGEHIGISRAYGRIIMKVLLGWVSLVTIAVTTGRRAVHDLSSGSIVVLDGAKSVFASWTKEKRIPPRDA